MQTNLITMVFLPAALGIIMLGLGLSLTPDDFKRVIKFPKAVFIGLFCQMLILPFVCFALTLLFGLAPELAVGLMLLSASPGGPTANLYSHLAKGDVALNITLTAINSLLTLFTLPFIVNFSISYFMETNQIIPMQFQKIMEVFAIVLIPVSIGMIIKYKYPKISAMLEKPVKIISALFLASIITAAVITERKNIIEAFVQVGSVVLLFNILNMAFGYFVPIIFRLPKKQAIAIGMEIGIHNGTLAIYIALTVLGNSVMSIPPAMYGFLMFFTAAAFGYIVNIKKRN